MLRINDISKVKFHRYLKPFFGKCIFIQLWLKKDQKLKSVPYSKSSVGPEVRTVNKSIKSYTTL